jgi:hypothetical protein
MWFVYLGGLPVAAAVAWLASRLFDTKIPGMVAAIAWMVAYMVIGFRIQLWPCPRCGKRFSAKWWYNKWLFARKCVHCGLPKYSNSDAGENV